jgi:hypothetical protein
MQSDPTSYLPLTESAFYILLTLAPGKKHGYAIFAPALIFRHSQVHPPHSGANRIVEIAASLLLLTGFNVGDMITDSFFRVIGVIHRD